MKNTLTAGAAVLLTTTIASAGGVDRSGQSTGILFESGDVVELSFSAVNPTVSGTAVAALGGFESEDMSESYVQLGFGVKTDINDQLSIAALVGQPYGGDVNYETGTNYFAAGSTADLNSVELTVIAKYQATDRASVFGGVRYQSIESEVTIPASSYVLETESTEGTGFLLGAAYEIPDIALRFALTYSSAIEHSQETTENAALETTTDFTAPQSINLDFQTGVAEDTLIFGTIRWVEWSEFAFTPAGFAAAAGGSSLLSYEDDTITYTVGLGRRLNEQLSAFATIGHEASTGGFSGNLGPTDGFTSIGLGGSYQVQENIKLTGGLQYIFVGDATVENPLAAGTDGAEFEDNSAIAGGLKVSYYF